MSDLRFARELGAEFKRLEREAAAGSPRRRPPWSSAGLPGRLATAMAVAVSLAVAVVALVLLSHARHGGQQATTNSASALTLSGGNCRTPAKTGPAPGGAPINVGADGMIRAAGGRVSGVAWQLRVKPLTEVPGSTQHARLVLGGRQYGLCSQHAVPVPFGLVDMGSKAIVYGYVPSGGGGYRISVSAGATRLATTTTDDQLFFISALPRPACSYRDLSVTAVSQPVAGLTPAIARSLDAAPTRFTTTMRFGGCRPQSLVKVVSARGQSSGRSPNAALAKVTQQGALTAPLGSHSHAGGTLWVLAHAGRLGLKLLAVRLSPGRYGVWLLRTRARPALLGSATIKHGELQGSYDLPPDVRGAQVVVATQASGPVSRPGQAVLQARLR